MKKALLAAVGLLALSGHFARAQTANATNNAPAYQPGTNALSMTLGGALRTTVISGGGGAGSGTSPYIFTPLGFQQLTATGTASTLTVPNGAIFAFITVEGANIRYRDDGTAPTATIGYLVAAGQQLTYSGTLATLQLISQSGSPVVDVLYYK